MATRSKAVATTSEPPPPPAPRAGSAVPVTEFVSVWVHHFGTTLAKNQTGFIFATRADADQMIADGDAILAGNLSFSGPNITRRPAAPPPPDPPDENGGGEPTSATVSSLIAGNPTWCNLTSVEPGTFANGRTSVRLSDVQGDPTAVAALEGQTVASSISHGGTRFNLQIDTTGLDLAGLTCVANAV